MKLLLDQCVPRTSVEHLQAMGIPAVHCGGCDLSRAADTEILQYARANGLVIVTLDSDFSHILALSGAASPTVIRVREEGLTAFPFAKLVETVTGKCELEIESGAMISATRKSVRLRRLPLNG